jgi:cobyrinic acid a,c-diamide synthase
MLSIPRIVIAAPSSGSGKSTIASGLMAAFSRQMTVQAFKVGPDYIDPMYHTAASGRPARNLDTWMLPDETVCQGFARASQTAELAIIEGVMGLFDGRDASPFNGSTAGVARLLQAPVVLVIDCASMSGSVAALAHGFNSFAPDLPLAGVICNRVGGERHAAWLSEAVKSIGLPVLGLIPRLPELQIPERHLGLFTVAERPAAVCEFLARVSEVMERYLDLPAILTLAQQAPPLAYEAVRQASPVECVPVRLAVAQDEAFCFYYEDNLDELRRCGAQILPFSPLKDEHLPVDVSGIYLGGGYPELYAAQLSANQSLRAEILAGRARDLPVYAECGGLMYLSEGIHLPEGHYPLVGALPGWCAMGDRLRMGYREIESLRPGLLGEAGLSLRGHEFHYSHWELTNPQHAAYRICPGAAGDEPYLDGYIQGNLQASYIHLHFGQDSRLVKHFVETCWNWQKNRNVAGIEYHPPLTVR